MIHSLAGELGLDVYIVSLSRMGLDDTTLSSLISELPERCIALMEDIDAAFHHGLTRDLDGENVDEAGKEHEQDREKEKAAVSSPLSRITLSGLLNALDGVGAQEGRILYATTNRYNALDPALCRPGRMDLHVEFKLASRYQARELFKCFYLPTDTDDKEAEQKEAEPEDDDADSAYGSLPSPASSAGEGDKLLDSDAAASEKLCVGNRHSSRGPTLSRARTLALAEQFGDAIPEREFSMASLQGYLMSYKTRPVAAAECAAAWVQRERVEKARKTKARHSPAA